MVLKVQKTIVQFSIYAIKYFIHTANIFKQKKKKKEKKKKKINSKIKILYFLCRFQMYNIEYRHFFIALMLYSLCNNWEGVYQSCKVVLGHFITIITIPTYNSTFLKYHWQFYSLRFQGKYDDYNEWQIGKTAWGYKAEVCIFVKALF